MQYHFDSLYAQSANGQNFYDLLDLMQSDENIRLAYRNIKRNTGSKTAGYDGLTIEDIKQLSVAEVVSTIQKMLEHYRPTSRSTGLHSEGKWKNTTFRNSDDLG